MIDLDTLLDEQLNQILSGPDALKPVIVFPEANDPRIISAASGLLNHARVVLLGDLQEIRSLCDYKSAELFCPRDRFFSMVQVVDPAQSDLKEELAQALSKVSQGRKWEMTPGQAADKIQNPVFFGAMLVRQGYADACLGGVANSSKDFLAPCLRLIKSSGTAFEMGLFCLPDQENQLWENNVVMFADVALNLMPNPEQLADIAVQACKTLRDIFPSSALSGVNGALLSYSTKGSGQGPSVENIRAAEPLVKEKLAALKVLDPAYEDISITGELQISVAVSRDAARVKLKNKLEEFGGAGRANVLIVPSLDEGNMLFHLFNTQYPDAKSSLVMGGMEGQVLDYSRGSSTVQVIRGAKLLLLTRIKGTIPLVRTSPVFPCPRILTLNPGDMSTQVGVFDGEVTVLEIETEHGPFQTEAGSSLVIQAQKRLEQVTQVLKAKEIGLSSLSMVLAQGGMLPSAKAGIYTISQSMLITLDSCPVSEHPSNLGAFMAWQISGQGKIPAFAGDCPTIDELNFQHRITGVKEGQKTPVWHALSQRHAVGMYGDKTGARIKDLNLIVAHLGSGISIGSHARGRCIHAGNAIYPGIQDICKIQDCTKDDPEVARGLDALATGISSQILARLSDFYPDPADQIIVTGSLCLSQVFLDRVLAKLSLAGPGTTVFAGSFELQALRDAGIRLYKEIEAPMEWTCRDKA